MFKRLDIVLHPLEAKWPVSTSAKYLLLFRRLLAPVALFLGAADAEASGCAHSLLRYNHRRTTGGQLILFLDGWGRVEKSSGQVEIAYLPACLQPSSRRPIIHRNGYHQSALLVFTQMPLLRPANIHVSLRWPHIPRRSRCLRIAHSSSSHGAMGLGNRGEEGWAESPQ